MSTDALRKLLSILPIESVEVELSRAQILTIKHPDAVLVLKNTLVVADPDAETV
jgi:hypothetical protein